MMNFGENESTKMFFSLYYNILGLLNVNVQVPIFFLSLMSYIILYTNKDVEVITYNSLIFSHETYNSY